ncbi:type II toxin-antitoxin system TacA family antitoxin [Acaryochloris thomasi]|uniref:type II toxin-antitoxin system TacA family antitoxin n=1 Tax=Acaryochloris thomasi TaxID=2929456 RepID=UPI000DA654C2|nr:DUF1778 domain-containing protein [Acaryochloris thomasi]
MAATHDRTTTSQTCDVKINIRAKQKQRDLIDHAARVQGKSRSEFILDSASQKAREVLLDQCWFDRDPQQFEQFLAILDEPPAKNEKLQALLAAKTPWG